MFTNGKATYLLKKKKPDYLMKSKPITKWLNIDRVKEIILPISRWQTENWLVFPSYIKTW